MMKVLCGFIVGVVVSHLALAWSASSKVERWFAQREAAWKTLIEEVEKDVPNIRKMQDFVLMRQFFNNGYTAGESYCIKKK